MTFNYVVTFWFTICHSCLSMLIITQPQVSLSVSHSCPVFCRCNEASMKLAVYNNGPMAVAFEVKSDFFHYK